MKFVDSCEVKVRAGTGGNGSVAFRRERFVPHGGPSGGDGGKGGDIVFEVDLGLSSLLDLTYAHTLSADDGEHGQGKDCYGRGGKDYIVRVPQGTQVFEAETGTLLVDLSDETSRAIVAEGGRGGRGNIHFATAHDRAPRRAEPGEPGQEIDLRLELKIMADVGLLGFPNVGKSTFIAAASRARPKIADYPFTTLVPNLGVVSVDRWKSFVIADIPGLIEGASDGAGLGIRFLKHLSRTRLLLHLVDMAPLDDTSAPDAAEVIVSELTKFSPALAERDRWLVLNKCDQILEEEHEERVKEIVDRLEWEGPVYVISAIAKEGTERLTRDIMRYLEDRADRLAADPVFKAELAELDQQIEDEARAQLQALDDQRALRRSGVKSVHDIGDDDWDEEDVDDEDGPEIIYVRD